MFIQYILMYMYVCIHKHFDRTRYGVYGFFYGGKTRI